MCNQKQQTTTQQQTNTPTGIAQLGDIWDRVKQVASTPYQAFNGQLVAGLTPTQQSGIQEVTNAQGAATPYFNQAANYATQGAAPINPANIQRYMNPYTNDVINATQANFNQDNAVQQQGVIGNAAAQGALGGDRVGVAQGELARQQNLAQSPVLAGLRATGYSQALQSAQADRSAAAQGAYTFGALAPSVQNAQISGAQAQIGAGGLEQGTNQAGLTAAYQQYLQAQAFPYQQTGFLASAGLPAVNAMGGSSSGTTTAPGPNPWAQIGGLALGATAALAKDGGRIEKAGGGPIGFADIPTYVPRFSQMGGGSNPFASAPHLPSVNPSAQNPMGGLTPTGAVKAGKSIGGLFGGDDPTATTGYTGNTSSPFAGVPDATTSYMGGTAYPMFGEANGGRVGYAEGGPVDTWADRWNPVPEGLTSGIANGGIDVSPGNWSEAYNRPTDNPFGGVVPTPRPRPDDVPGTLPPIMTAGMGQDSDALPPDAMAYNARQPTNPMAMSGGQPMVGSDGGILPPDAAGASPYAIPGPGGGMPPPAPAPTTAAPTGRTGLLGLNLSDEARMGLMAAGLGIAASKSPFALSAIGEGGLTGLKTYAQQKEQKQSAEQEARKLAQQAEQFSQNLGLHKDTLAETIKQHGITNERALVPTGYRKDKDGNLEAIPGGPEDPAVLKEHAEAKIAEGGLLDPETVKYMAQQLRAGDTSVLTNLGRGAQGAQNVILVRREAQRQNASEGLGGADQALRNAEFFGTKAGQRTLGTRQANIELASTEFKQVLPVVQQASKAVNRTNYPDLNRIIQMGMEKTGDPNIVKLGSGINTLINLYARAISPTGVPTVSDKDHAREVLSKAWSQGQFDAATGMMTQEIDAALQSPEKVRDEMRKRFIGGQGAGSPAPAAPAAIPTVAPADKQALDWANANPTDPRAIAIKKKLGMP